MGSSSSKSQTSGTAARAISGLLALQMSNWQLLGAYTEGHATQASSAFSLKSLPQPQFLGTGTSLSLALLHPPLYQVNMDSLHFRYHFLCLLGLLVASVQRPSSVEKNLPLSTQNRRLTPHSCTET